MDRSHVILKLILNSDQGLTLFRQKQILTGLLVTKIYKKVKIFLLNTHFPNRENPYVDVSSLFPQVANSEKVTKTFQTL